jgi:hypothetical protein
MLGSSGARSIIMYRLRTAFECGYGNPSPACWLRCRFATFRGQCKIGVFYSNLQNSYITCRSEGLRSSCTAESLEHFVSPVANQGSNVLKRSETSSSDRVLIVPTGHFTTWASSGSIDQ